MFEYRNLRSCGSQAHMGFWHYKLDVISKNFNIILLPQTYPEYPYSKSAEKNIYLDTFNKFAKSEHVF